MTTETGSLVASDKGSVEPIEPGVYVAVCYAVVDLGTQYSEKFGKHARKVVITWEIPELMFEFEKDGVKKTLPKAISSRYTLSLGLKSTLRGVLESWRGRPFSAEELAGFDLRKLIGAACQVQIAQRQGTGGRVVSFIQSVMAMPKGVKAPALINPPLFFNIASLTGKTLPPWLPEWLAKIIAQSKEYEMLCKAQPGQTGDVPVDHDGPATTDDDDLPF